MLREMFKKAFSKEEASTDPAAVRLPKPQEMVDLVGRDLVVAKGREPDWVWNLKCVLLPIQGEKKAYFVRVFSPGAAGNKKVNVKNYHSLDGHPDLILYSAYFDRKKMFVQVNEGAEPPIRDRAA